jgi:alkanesulfonate monooxygenase SsuD/methylene tetrahydromethanopterin reductase-like flavin-dependent oxidoreductase (luciferase family)
VKLGLFMMPVHPPEKPRTQCFEEDIELILRAEELGFAEAWIGQHHTLAWEPIPSNDVFIENVFPRTRTIRLGTGVSIIPQHHPANVALRLALLDHLSHGRLNCGFGQGGVPTDHELFGLPDSKTQGLMTLEGIDMILRLWQAEAPSSSRDNSGRSRSTILNPELGMGELLRPYQKPHPPIAMSVIKADSMAARLAGVRGYLPEHQFGALVHGNSTLEDLLQRGSGGGSHEAEPLRLARGTEHLRRREQRGGASACSQRNVCPVI